MITRKGVSKVSSFEGVSLFLGSLTNEPYRGDWDENEVDSYEEYFEEVEDEVDEEEYKELYF